MEDLPARLGLLRLTLPCSPSQAAGCSAAAGGAAVGVSGRAASRLCVHFKGGGGGSTDTERTDASLVQKGELDSPRKVVVVFS